MAELLALLAAGCFALGTTLQQRGTLETAAGEGDPRFLIQILQRPMWLLGGLFQVVGWILQAAALNLGSLDVVQSITALSLAIALPLGVWLTSQQVGRRQVVGALQTVGGIVVFVAVGSPETGTTHPTATAWWFASLACGAAVVALAGLGWRRRGATGAVLLGAGAGVGFAFQAAVTKLLVHQLGGWAQPRTYHLDALCPDRHSRGQLRTPAIRAEDGRARTFDGLEQLRNPWSSACSWGRPCSARQSPEAAR